MKRMALVAILIIDRGGKYLPDSDLITVPMIFSFVRSYLHMTISYIIGAMSLLDQFS